MRKPLAVLSTVLILATTAFALISLSNTQLQKSDDSPVPEPVVLGITDDLSISNEIISNVNEGNNTFLISYRYTITHDGNYPALNLSANSWFNDSIANSFQIVSLTTGSHLTLNPSFDGKSDRSLLSGSNFMPANSSAQIVLTIRLTYNDQNRQFINFVETAGDSDDSSNSSSSSSASSSASGTSSDSTTSSHSGTTPTGTTTTSTSSSSSVSATVSTTVSAPGSGGSIGGLYDSSQVTFIVVNGEALSGFIGKGQ